MPVMQAQRIAVTGQKAQQIYQVTDSADKEVTLTRITVGLAIFAGHSENVGIEIPLNQPIVFRLSPGDRLYLRGTDVTNTIYAVDMLVQAPQNQQLIATLVNTLQQMLSVGGFPSPAQTAVYPQASTLAIPQVSGPSAPTLTMVPPQTPPIAKPPIGPTGRPMCKRTK